MNRHTTQARIIRRIIDSVDISVLHADEGTPAFAQLIDAAEKILAPYSPDTRKAVITSLRQGRFAAAKNSGALGHEGSASEIDGYRKSYAIASRLPAGSTRHSLSELEGDIPFGGGESYDLRR